MTTISASQASQIPHLEYYGGRILQHPVFVPLYIGSYWKTPAGSKEVHYLDKFAGSLAKSSYMKTLAEYGVGSGKFGGSTTINSVRNPSYLDDRGIQKLVSQALASKAKISRDPQAVYTVFLPPGTVLLAPGEVSSREGVGGYHSSFKLPNGSRVYYAAIVYGQQGNGIPFSKKAIDNVTIAASHEWAEAATDPDVNQEQLSWYDENYGEVADIPIAYGLPLSRVWGRMGRYAVQKEWSNKDAAFEIRPLQP